MLNIWIERQWIYSGTMTLEDIDAHFESFRELDSRDRAAIRELIQQIDIHKYQGGLSGDQCAKTVNDFDCVLDIVEKG